MSLRVCARFIRDSAVLSRCSVLSARREPASWLRTAGQSQRFCCCLFPSYSKETCLYVHSKAWDAQCGNPDPQLGPNKPGPLAVLSRRLFISSVNKQYAFISHQCWMTQINNSRGTLGWSCLIISVQDDTSVRHKNSQSCWTFQYVHILGFSLGEWCLNDSKTVQTPGVIKLLLSLTVKKM